MSGTPANPGLPVLDDGGGGRDDARAVLITGAAGNIGRKLRDAWRDRYDLIALDRVPDPDQPDLVVADLAEWDASWLDLCEDVDAIVHLAANPSPDAAWPDLVGPNLDAVANILLAALERGVERVVLASSVHVMAGYFESPEPITCDMPPAPLSPYGSSKLAAERLGRCLAIAAGLSVVAIRVGWVLPGENRPEDLPPISWGRGLWLSNRDLVELFTRAIEADLEPGSFTLVHGVSRNAGSTWSRDEAESLLGYRAVDGIL